LALVLLLSARAISYAAVRFLRRRGRLSEPVAILGNGSVSEALVSHMREHPEYGLTPIGYLGQERNTDCRAPWLGPNERLDEIIQQHGLRRILVAFSDVREHALVEILRIAAQQGVDIHVVPRFFDVPLRFGSMDEIWGIPLHELPARPLQSTGWKVKRLVDIAVSGTGLLLVAPVLLSCALAVRLSSPGPVLFRQLRLGQHRRPFEILKFRTMRVNVLSDTAWSRENDPRQTAVGRVLRRYNLDELAQLWNVFRGDMSLIGPRPERPHFVELFEESIPHYAARHRVPVGITGLAQVQGLRGDTSIAERVRFDNRYIDGWSLWQDAVIAARTFAQVVRMGS
jgi:exopolysaccharide biosynthesis polyprenyl glycosylphosphotransferase